MDKKDFEEILVKNNQNLIEGIDKKVNITIEQKIKENNVVLLDEIDKKIDQKIDKRFKEIDKKFAQIDKRFDQIEQRRIDDNFYFEHKYWDKISIIFDKLQLNDDLKKLDDEKNKKLEQRVERNSAQLMLQGNRISKLEKVINSK